ncbi:MULTISPECIES: glycosyltransferase [unclassified Bradyrhizobium]
MKQVQTSQQTSSLPNQHVVPGAKTVLVYRNELLPLSETFIKEQILALRDWRAVLVGRKMLHELPLDELDVRLTGQTGSGFAHRTLSKAQRILGTVPTKVVNELKTENALLLHVHFGTDALDAWPIARALKLPMLVTLHGYDINTHREWWEAGHGGLRMRFYPRRLLRLARHPNVSFIAVSKALRQRAIEFGIPSDKISVHYIGIDTTKFSTGPTPIRDRAPRVLFVGRLVEKKGCRYLIEAMALVQRKLPAAQLIIIGEGPLRQELELVAAQLGVAVIFRGARSSAEVKQEVDTARILCLPSITARNGDAESFGLVLLEAQASGVPVVSSALGGAAEGIRDGITGISFPERDIKRLADILGDLLDDEESLSKMAQQAQNYVATEFDLARCTEQLELLYDAFRSRHPVKWRTSNRDI